MKVLVFLKLNSEKLFNCNKYLYNFKQSGTLYNKVTILKNLTKFSSVITEIKKNNYNLALKLLNKIKSNKKEKHLEHKLYG